ncbi:glutathione gamma-glutamylcysteinyltransferase 3-like isoform X2 [Durio zibethinus]|uniref:glutathione gamma-glutamylcysteinyltransferase n=1 Tax=Durio zibethinus TaxID=66656 RepID=A0A6P6A0G5_DURZI|nr:glutathione gamma-glutamylcysteinyltransferase 3-like isoform X2 [Durio zibethinus]
MALAGLYRRILPSPPAIEFPSPEGKQLFTEALAGGTAEGFFKLISYYQTQSEPAYCGLATLAMVLNALAIDPGKIWKGPWRWFDDSMLDCCEPLEKIKSQGVTFGKVACLAVCNGAQVEPFRTDQSSLDDFRKRVISCTSSEDCHLIVSYNRAVFKQTGTGHFSPIGGYHAGKDMVLILDVARFKYPPHWVPLSLLWDAMNTIDKDTGHHRGLAFCRFMVISRLQKATSVLYTVSCRHEGWNAVAKYLTEDVPLLFTSKNLNDVDDVLCVVFRLAPSNLRDFIQWVAEVRRQDDGGTVLSEEEKGRLALKEEVLKQIRETELFKHVTRYLAFESSLCKNLAPSGYKDGLADIAANVCCQGAKLLTGKIRSANGLCCKDMIVKLLKAESKEAVTVVSGTVITDGTEQMVDMLIPSSQTEPSCFCDFDQNSCCGIHPSIGDGLTVLLFSLPQDTWLGLKEEKLQAEMKGLTSVDSLPTLLQEEVMSGSFFLMKFLVFPFRHRLYRFFFNHFPMELITFWYLNFEKIYKLIPKDIKYTSCT